MNSLSLSTLSFFLYVTNVKHYKASGRMRHFNKREKKIELILIEIEGLSRFV